MNLFRLLPCLAAATFVYALSAHSHAYCLTYTCDASKEDCPRDPQTGCNVGGKPLFWASSVISFDVQQDGSKTQNISYDQLHEAVVNAFQRWLDAPCDDSHGPSIKLADFGKVECAKPEYNKTQPNQNVITFHDAEWPYKNTGSETLALTTVFFAPDTGEIYDANIELNSYNAKFVLGPSDADERHDDLNAVLSHEIGHFLGLSHSTDREATMYASYELDMTTLEADDIEAICASLPPGRTTTDPGNPPGVPRHGFSTKCSSPENGCCASTIGGNTPASGPLALWAFGLGLVAWCGRGRAKRLARSAPALPR
ncbi:MAG TPA: matrixin family metalloprotease [Polyangiaceae bacterium]|nr:matrixin family metalloprotease [Polyangiaceae bacterium]